MSKLYSKLFIKKYLEDHIKQSIENDVGTALKAFSDKWLNETIGVGYFAVPRLLFPEIDCLGSYITGNSQTTVLNIKTYLLKIMSSVDPNYGKYAGFIGKVYRNGLLHQHAPKRFRYKKRQLGWAFQVGSPNLPISALRKFHLKFVGNNLWIHTNVFYNDVLKSFDFAIPEITSKYQKEFSKSYREQYKNLYISSCTKKRSSLNKHDFDFLKELKT